MKKKEFLKLKENALKSLREACVKGSVDKGILPILDQINKIPGFFTTSSCSGRIVFLEIPKIGDKHAANFLGIWHRTIGENDFYDALGKSTKGLLWLLAQAPILHIGVETPQHADTMVKTAISCGLKNSSIRSLGKRTMIEICSTERLDAPIGRDGCLFYDKNHLFLLIEISNEVIWKSQVKLGRFAKKLENINLFL